MPMPPTSGAPDPTNKQRAVADATAAAVAALASAGDWRERAARRELLMVDSAAGPAIPLRLFGRQLQLVPPGFAALDSGSPKPVPAGDRLLALHYLLHDAPVSPAGEWISFREFSGGQFYWEPFRARTVLPLIARFGNDVERLKKNLDRFAWEPATGADLAVRLHVVGPLWAQLQYYVGEEGLPPEAVLLFDAALRRVFCTEDAAVIGSRLCLGLL